MRSERHNTGPNMQPTLLSRHVPNTDARKIEEPLKAEQAFPQCSPMGKGLERQFSSFWPQHFFITEHHKELLIMWVVALALPNEKLKLRNS